MGRMEYIGPDKEKVRKRALKEGRKVLWLDDKGHWHAATDRANTPGFAKATEDVELSSPSVKEG